MFGFKIRMKNLWPYPIFLGSNKFTYLSQTNFCQCQLNGIEYTKLFILQYAVKLPNENSIAIVEHDHTSKDTSHIEKVLVIFV